MTNPIGPISNQVISNYETSTEFVAPREAFICGSIVGDTYNFIAGCVSSVIYYLSCGYLFSNDTSAYTVIENRNLLSDANLGELENLFEELKTNFSFDPPEDLNEENLQKWNDANPAWKEFVVKFVNHLEKTYAFAKHAQFRPKFRKIALLKLVTTLEIEKFISSRTEDPQYSTFSDRLRELQNKIDRCCNSSSLPSFTQIPHNRRCAFFNAELNKLTVAKLNELPAILSPEDVIRDPRSPFNGKTFFEAWEMRREVSEKLTYFFLEGFKKLYSRLERNNFILDFDPRKELLSPSDSLLLMSEIASLQMITIFEPTIELFISFLVSLAINTDPMHAHRVHCLEQQITTLRASWEPTKPTILLPDEAQVWDNTLPTLIPSLREYGNRLDKLLKELQYSHFLYPNIDGFPEEVIAYPDALQEFINNNEDHPLAKILDTKLSALKNEIKHLTTFKSLSRLTLLS